MKFKKKFMKTLAISMAFSMLFCNSAFATEIDLADSTESVATDTLNKTEGTDYFADENNEWLDGTINEEVRITVDLASQFEITIPKEVVLDGETGKADYKVKAVGDIAGDQKLSVIPDPDFVLSEAGGKADVTATVTQADTEYVYTDLQGDGTEYDGSIAATLTAGEWSGKFYFNIKFDGGESNSGSDDTNHTDDVSVKFLEGNAINNNNIYTLPNTTNYSLDDFGLVVNIWELTIDSDKEIIIPYNQMYSESDGGGFIIGINPTTENIVELLSGDLSAMGYTEISGISGNFIQTLSAGTHKLVCISLLSTVGLDLSFSTNKDTLKEDCLYDMDLTNNKLTCINCGKEIDLSNITSIKNDNMNMRKETILQQVEEGAIFDEDIQYYDYEGKEVVATSDNYIGYYIKEKDIRTIEYVADGIKVTFNTSLLTDKKIKYAASYVEMFTMAFSKIDDDASNDVPSHFKELDENNSYTIRLESISDLESYLSGHVLYY